MERNRDDIIKLRDGARWWRARGKRVKELSGYQPETDQMKI